MEMSDRVISEKYNLPANTVGRYRGRKYLSDSNNPSLNFMIWNWQNLPGINNTKPTKENSFVTCGTYMDEE
jgi:hypothetical protein